MENRVDYNLSVNGAEESVAKLKSVESAAKSAANAVSAGGGAAGGAAGQQETLNKTLDKQSKTTNVASKSQENYFVHIAKTTVQSALVNKAFIGLVDSAGKAVKQVDLLQNFPATMVSLGQSSTDASDALKTLRGYVAGIGGDLTAATTSVVRFTEVTKDVKAATVEFAGVNNALIAGAAPAEVQKNALEQLTQAYSRGKPQLIEWKSLMVAMPAQLNAVARAMNLPNAGALGEQLTKGKVSMQDFVTKLTELSVGTGSIAAQARIKMTGIEFASNQMSAALTNGLTAIFQAVGRENIVAFLQFLTQVIGVTAKFVVILINDLITLFNWVSNVFGGPQIAHFSGDAQKTSDALGSGAANAGDMADGLGNAADNAAQINKSLASFDKMNVLPDKTSGKAPKDSGLGGTGPLDAATAAKLHALFDGMGNALQEASKWAKILAGILLGLAGNALIAKLFGFNPLKELISDLGKAAKGFLGLGKSTEELAKEAEKNGTKAGNNYSQKFGESAAKGFGKLGGIISGAFTGLAAIIVETVAPAVGTALLAIGAAIAAPFLALAEIVALPVELVVALVILAVAAIVAVVWLIWTNWQTIWGFIKGLFDTVWGAIVSVWNTLFDIFAGPIRFLLELVRSIFILIVAIIAIALEAIFKLVVGTFVLIYTVLAAVAGWINTNLIQPVWQLFQSLWDTITGIFVAAWQFIFTSILLPVAGWINTNVIMPIVNFFRAMWTTISGFISGIFNSFVNILSPLGSWIYNNIILPIGRFFSGLWDGIKNGLSSMVNSLGSIFGSIGNIVKAPLNAMIDLLNKALSPISNLKVPSWVPGLGGKSVSFPGIPIPHLATGGIIKQATTAIIGESGAEAVMPLENNTAWIDTLASKLNKQQNDGQPVTLVVQIGEDKIATKVIQLINEKTNMSGRNTIYV